MDVPDAHYNHQHNILQMSSYKYIFCFVQCEENTNLADCSRYLKLPCSKANLPSNNQTLKSPKESFWITSFLCSTKLTQNGKLHFQCRGVFSF